LQRNLNHPTIVTIEKVIDETPTVRTLVFSDDIMSNVLPGQFAMVWIPGINELPMSVMISQESGKAAFTVRKHGPASTGLFNIKKINKNRNIFFDFLNYTFRIWPKYFWKKPNLYKISNYFSDLLNYLFKK